MNALLVDSILGSLKRAPVLALTVVLLIAIGVGVTVPMLTVKHHLESDPIPGKSDRLFYVQIDNWRKDEPFLRPDRPPNAITLRDALALEQSSIPGRAAPMYQTHTTIRPEKRGIRPFRLDARVTGRDFFSMFDTPFLHGGVWSEEEERARKNVAVISRTLSNHLFNSENSVGDKVRINDNYYTIVGVIDDWSITPRFYDMNDPFASPEHVYLPFSLIFSAGFQPTYWRTPYGFDQKLTRHSFEELFSNSEVIFVQYWVELSEEAKVQDYKSFLNQYMQGQKDLGRFPRELHNRLVSSKDWITVSTETSRDVGGITAMIVVMMLFFAVCLCNSISLLLTKFLKFTGRSSLFRALGASQRFIFSQHLVEVTVLSTLGGLLGIGFSVFTLEGVKRLYENESMKAAEGFLSYQAFDEFWVLDGTMMVVCLGLALVGGLLAGIYPALKVCRIPPSIQLKSL